MGVTTGIAWTDATVNFWWGCTKVSPGCTNCYAATRSKRYGYDEWGPGKPRRQIKGVAGTVKKIVARAKAEGRRLRAFTNSMADFFDAEVSQEWRDAAWKVIRETAGWIDWQILTKRPENIAAMLPKDWGSGWPNVWLGVTTENQERADERVPILLKIPAAVRFVSYEPALGAVDFGAFLEEQGCESGGPCGWISTGRGLDWIIVGGESGHGARPFDMDWPRAVLSQAREAGVAVFVKQMGDAAGRVEDGHQWLVRRFTAHHGADPSEWPVDLRVQDFPEAARP